MEGRVGELEALWSEVRAKVGELERLNAGLSSVVGKVKTIRELALRIADVAERVLR